MGEIRALAVIKYGALSVLLFSLFALAFSLGQNALQGMAIKDMQDQSPQDMKTYTKAVCSRQQAVVDCEDVLMLGDGEIELKVRDSQELGRAKFHESEFRDN